MTKKKQQTVGRIDIFRIDGTSVTHEQATKKHYDDIVDSIKASAHYLTLITENDERIVLVRNIVDIVWTPDND